MICTNVFAGETEITRLKSVGFSVQQSNEIDDIYLATDEVQTLITPTISGNTTYSDNNALLLKSSNNGRLIISGGVTTAAADGSKIELQGTGYDGNLTLSTGNVSSNSIYLDALGTASTVSIRKASAADLWVFNQSGQFVQNATNGGNLVMSKASTGIVLGATAVDADVTTLVGTQPSIYAFLGAPIFAARGTADALSPNVYITKSRATDGSANTIVQTNDGLGAIIFSGSDGTSFRQAAAIEASVNTTPGASDMPGKLSFKTSADGAITPLTRWEINMAGNLQQDATNGGDLIISKSGSTISLQEATPASACMGAANPNGTTNVVVSTTCFTTGSRVFYTRVGTPTNFGHISTVSSSAGVSFTLVSSNASDTTAATVVWWIVRESA